MQIDSEGVEINSKLEKIFFIYLPKTIILQSMFNSDNVLIDTANGNTNNIYTASWGKIGPNITKDVSLK